MDKKDICIVIPIYKETLNEFESKSIDQCIKILSDYSIFFVCPKDLSLEFYSEKFPEIKKIFYFDNDYFKDLEGYNKLMLSTSFYEAFNNYEFMLIYQTDCFVFKDELLEWCKKDFDYIGGLWFDDYIGDPNLGAKLWKAGNGGLSLRKIKSTINLLNSKKRKKTYNQLVAEKMELYKNGEIKHFKIRFLLLLNILGYRNNYKFFAKNYDKNEDVFFIEASIELKKFKVPTVDEALTFSWDRCPDFLYDKIKALPFGCHAWFREDYPYKENKKFWFDYI